MAFSEIWTIQDIDVNASLAEIVVSGELSLTGMSTTYSVNRLKKTSGEQSFSIYDGSIWIIISQLDVLLYGCHLSLVNPSSGTLRTFLDAIGHLPDEDVDVSDKTFFIKENPSFTLDTTIHGSFTSGGSSFTQISVLDNDGDTEIWYVGSSSVIAYAAGVWEAEYRYLTYVHNETVVGSEFDILMDMYEEYIPPAHTIFDLSSLSLPAGIYEIKVKGKANGYRDSEFSNTVTYTVTAQLTAPIIQLSDTVVRWDAVEHASSYVVRVDGNDEPAIIATSFDLSTLTLEDGSHTVQVYAKGVSPYLDSNLSNSITYTVLPQLDTPTNLTADGTTISFDAVENAESYEVFADGVSIGEYTPVGLYSVSVTNTGTQNMYFYQNDLLGESKGLAPAGTTTIVVLEAGIYYLNNLQRSSYVESAIITGNISLSFSYLTVNGNGTLTGAVVNCIEENEIITTTNGLKKVKDLTLKDKLIGVNGINSILELEPSVSNDCYKLTLSNNESVIFTATHILIRQDLTQVLVKDLQVGENLYNNVSVKSIEKLNGRYNVVRINVDGDDTFLVRNNFYSHNK